eukprot:3436314-Amphidinium_carterae.1
MVRWLLTGLGAAKSVLMLQMPSSCLVSSSSRHRTRDNSARNCNRPRRTPRNQHSCAVGLSSKHWYCEDGQLRRFLLSAARTP